MARFDCCKGCLPPKRNAWCHSTCPEYLGDRAEDKAEKERVRRIMDAEDDYIGVKARTAEAIKRRIHR